MPVADGYGATLLQLLLDGTVAESVIDPVMIVTLDVSQNGSHTGGAQDEFFLVFIRQSRIGGGDRGILAR